MRCLLVNIWFQVLFHSPPGVLFTVPSRYYSLSVTKSYLAFGDGPPIFTQDSSCPVLLWIPFLIVYISPTRLLLRFVHLSKCVQLYILLILSGPKPHRYYYLWFGLLQFRSPLLPQSLIYFLFLWVLRCFSSPGSLHNSMYSCYDTMTLS